MPPLVLEILSILMTFNNLINKILMKKLILNIVSIFALLLMVGCQDDGFSFGSIDTPTNLDVKFEIIGKTAAAPFGDGSGKVKFTSVADNAISYQYIFPDEAKNAPSGILEKRFTTNGTNKYTVVVLASGKGGVTTNTTIEVEVYFKFEDPEAVAFLTGGSSKKWYWAQSEVGHLGVGPNTAHTDPDFGKQNYYPAFYGATANEKSGTCLYNSIMTFSLASGQLKYALDNQGQTFFNAGHAGVAGGSGSNGDACFAFDTTGLKSVSLSPSESFVSLNPDSATQTRGTMMSFSNGGFMGYYVGATSYEILSITDNRMVVRCIDANNSFLAWYHTFTSTAPGSAPAAPDDYTVLKFSDEFNTDGSPDPSKWVYDLGNGISGWGNNEVQNYTNLANNVKVAGGNLVITAIKETSGGQPYSSARIKTDGKYKFTYGKIEARAKMPIGGGTWPAIWSLGSNYNTAPWPACGEIDFMEHVGNQQNKIFGSLHYPGFSGGNANTGTKVITNASTEFHIYKVIWNSATIRFYVDNVLFHTATNSATLPFNKDFFLIMNVAMGGNFGGAIDSAFTQSSMEVDYIRVYQ